MPFTKSQLNKLGERLRSEQSITLETRERLEEFRTLYDAPMARAQALVKEQLDLDAMSRLKTVNTIVEKLRREKTRLSEMQDIAGLRIVVKKGLKEQDQRLEQLLLVFPSGRVVDRRKRPSHGYRAIHVVAQVDGVPVEVQLRTRIQDVWAQAMERLADELGRDIRYGWVPEQDGERLRDLLDRSDLINDLEEMERERPGRRHTIHKVLRGIRGRLKRI